MLAVLCVVCTGCFPNDFDETKMRFTTEGAPVQLDSEQVTVTYPQVDCGVQQELWDAPVQVSERSVAKLRQSARDMGFTDDVSVNEPGYTQPYAQVRGKFMLRVETLLDTKDGPGQGSKTSVAQVRVKMPNDCFAGDLPMMGIRKGQFTQGQPVTIVFNMGGDGWVVDPLRPLTHKSGLQRGPALYDLDDVAGAQEHHGRPAPLPQVSHRARIEKQIAPEFTPALRFGMTRSTSGSVGRIHRLNRAAGRKSSRAAGEW